MKHTKLFHAWWCLAFLMIGFVFMTRMHYGVGLYYADDFAYVEAALNANEDSWYSYLASLPNIYANRVSVVIPVAFCMKLFGSTEGLLQYVALAFSLGAIACAFLLGEVLRNRAVGFLAAIVASFIPLEIRNATAILPDVFIPFYAGMSLLCLAKGLMSSKNEWQELCLYVLSGFFLFCAFEARATCGILIIPLALGALWLKKHNIRAVFLPTASFFIFVSLFWLFLYIISGDFLIQYRRFIVDATMPKYYGTGSVLGHAKKMVPIINVLLDPAGFFHSGFPLNGKDFQRYLMNFELGLFYYLVWPAFFYCAVKSWKEKWPRLPLAAFGLLYLFFEFGSTNLMEYKPIWKLNRFLTILTVPGAVLTGMFVVDLWNIRLKKKGRCLVRTVTILVVLVYVGVAYISLNQLTKFNDKSVQTYREVFKKIKSDHPNRKIYVIHGRWELRGTVFMRLQPVMPCKFFPLAGVSVDDIHQAIVILDLSFFTKYGERKLKWKTFDSALRNVPKALPEGWKLISKHRRPMKRGRIADVYVLWAP